MFETFCILGAYKSFLTIKTALPWSYMLNLTKKFIGCDSVRPGSAQCSLYSFLGGGKDGYLTIFYGNIPFPLQIADFVGISLITLYFALEEAIRRNSSATYLQLIVLILRTIYIYFFTFGKLILFLGFILCPQSLDNTQNDRILEMEYMGKCSKHWGLGKYSELRCILTEQLVYVLEIS